MQVVLIQWDLIFFVIVVVVVVVVVVVIDVDDDDENDGVHVGIIQNETRRK